VNFEMSAPRRPRAPKKHVAAPTRLFELCLPGGGCQLVEMQDRAKILERLRGYERDVVLST
jgi:hypothetical protein